MDALALDPAWIALIGTLCGGAGLKLAEHWLGRNQVKVSDATQIRDELRQEVKAAKEEIVKLEAEVEKWRAEYYNLRDEHVKLQTQLTLTLSQLKAQADQIAEPPTP